MFDELTKEQIKFLKDLRKSGAVTLDDLQAKYPPEKLNRTFYMLDEYIDSDAPPVYLLGNDRSNVKYSISDHGIIALIRYKDMQSNFIARILADKGLDILVAFVTSLITTIVTYHFIS